MHTTCGIFSTMNNISKRELKPRFYVVFVRLMQQRQFWLFAAWTLEVLYCLPLRSWALWLRLVLGILLSAEITGKINALAFFLSFSVRQLWLELQWFCSLWECCCYCGVPLCQSSGVERVGTMQYSDGCSVKVTSTWMPEPRVSHFYLSLVSWTSGVVDFIMEWYGGSI